MCLVTKEPRGHISDKKMTVYKELFLYVWTLGEYAPELHTPFEGVLIKHIPCIEKARKPIGKKDTLQHLYNFYCSETDKYVTMYECTSEAVHAYLYRTDRCHSFMCKGFHSPFGHQGTYLRFRVEAQCVIPKGTRIYECYRPYNSFYCKDYDISAEKLYLNKIFKPLKQTYSKEAWENVKKYAIPEIRKINEHFKKNKKNG